MVGETGLAPRLGPAGRERDTEESVVVVMYVSLNQSSLVLVTESGDVVLWLVVTGAGGVKA